MSRDAKPARRFHDSGNPPETGRVSERDAVDDQGHADGAMIDERLRSVKESATNPVARRLAGRVSPLVLTEISLVAGVGAGVLSAVGSRWMAVAMWLVGRCFDGLDGAVARFEHRQSDLGGYLDMMADTVGYAAVPIGVAVERPGTAVWVACALLLASFYVNTVSWTYLAAVAEKRRTAGTGPRGEYTTVHMPAGLIEGAETVVLFTLMLAIPGWSVALFGTMAVLVVITAASRVRWALRNLT